MFISKKFIPRRTFLRGAGVTHRVASAGFDGSGADTARTRLPRLRCGAFWGSGTRTARRRAIGAPCRKARTSSSPSSPNLSNRSGTA